MKKIFLMIMIFSIVLPFYAQHEYLKKEFKYISTAPSYMVVKVKSQTYEGYAAINTLGFREYYNKTAGILKKKMYNKLAYRDIIRNKCFVVADSDFNDVHENILAFDKIIMNDSVVAISKRGMECFIKTYFDAHGDLKVTQGVPYDFGTIVKIMFDAGIQTGIGCLYSNYQIKDERFYGEKGFTIPPEFRDSIMDDTTFSMSAGFNPKSSSRMEALHQRTIEQFSDLVSENDGSVPIYNDETIDIPSLQAYSAVANADIFYYHTNHLSSTMYVTDAQQSVVQSFLYAPYGDIISEYNTHAMGDAFPKYSFNAKELDEETGMYYYEARYYKPPVFSSRDPLMDQKPWLNPYHYCSNNPVGRVDPSGCEDWIPPTDGSGNWTAEQGDGYWRLAQQAGISVEKARGAVVTANQNRGQVRTSETMVYPGDVVHIGGSNTETNSETNRLSISIYPCVLASGRIESVSLIETLCDEIVGGLLQDGLISLGMDEKKASYLSSGIIFFWFNNSFKESAGMQSEIPWK